MPIYGFTCTHCGPFEVARPASDAAQPAACPECGGEGRRVFSPPGLYRTSPGLRRMCDLEQKSAHEPEVVRQPRGRPLPHRHHAWCRH